MMTGYQLWLLHSLLVPAVLLTTAILWPAPKDADGTEHSKQG
jgi:hypothetical protein